MNKLPRKYKLYISFMLIGIVLLVILPTSCTCNCSPDDDVGGDWNPDDLGMNNRILYLSYEDGSWEIYLVKTDGTSQVKLADGEYPSSSPNGQKIVFLSSRDSQNENQIYIMDVNGENQTSLTSDPGMYSSPIWLPDGSQIAYIYRPTSPDLLAQRGLYVMNSDGSNPTRITSKTITDPKWSPDGSQIAYNERRGPSFSAPQTIYVMNADDSNVVSLTDDIDTYCVAPVWSPDGSKIAFMCKLRDGEGRDYGNIYVMNADGSNKINLTDRLWYDMYPIWSPNGTQIAFVASALAASAATPDIFNEIYVMDADGTGLVKIADTTSDTRLKSWSADGTRIVYYSLSDENNSIWTINTDGTNQTKLVDITTEY